MIIDKVRENKAHLVEYNRIRWIRIIEGGINERSV